MASSAKPDITSLTVVAVKAVKEGRDEEALQALNQLVAHDSSSPLWPQMRGQICLRQGDASSALEDAERALALAPGNADALILKAEALQACGHGASQQRECLEAALRTPSLSAAKRAEVEKSLAALPASDEGSTATADTRVKKPSQVELLSVCDLAAKGMKASKAGEAAEAEACFSELCKRDENSALWPCLLAQARIAKGENDKALIDLDMALARDPSNVEALFLRGKLLLGKDESAAHADFLKAKVLPGLAEEKRNELLEHVNVLQQKGSVPKPPEPAARGTGGYKPTKPPQTVQSSTAASSAASAASKPSADSKPAPDKKSSG